MKIWAKSVLFLVAGAGVALGGAYLYVDQVTRSKRAQVYPDPALALDASMQGAIAQGDIELGRRIVQVRNGCTDCHGKDLAGAVIMDNPAMGQIAGANITPFRTAAWSDAQWVKAVRYGLNQDNQALVLMPSHEYFALSQADLGAVIAYLKSLPAIDKPSPEVKLGPVAKALLAFERAPTLLSAQTLNFDAPFSDKPQEAATVAFGDYLAKTTCSGCHGPNYQGGPIPGGAPDWPEAANLHGLAAKQWNAATFDGAVRHGENSEGVALKAPMPQFQFNDQEVEALWLYFQQLS